MKLLKYIPVAVMAMMAFVSCDSDLDKLTYNEKDRVPGTLSAVQPSYILLEKKANEVAETFKWTEASFGYNAAITYRVEIDLAGHNFANKKTISSTVAKTEASITNKELNDIVVKFYSDSIYKTVKPGTKATYQIRLAAYIGESVAPAVSNVQSVDITTYVPQKEFPKIWVIGDYCGWSHDNSQFIYSKNSDDEYEGWICFNGKAANGWKFTPEAGWENDWGADKANPPAAEVSKQVLQVKGDNIVSYSGYAYLVKFNKATKQLTMENKITTSFGLIGDATPGAWANSTDMTFDPATRTFSAELELTTGKQFKFRADNAWEIDFGAGEKAGELSFKGNNIDFTGSTGKYKVTVNLNKVIPTYTLEPVK